MRPAATSVLVACLAVAAVPGLADQPRLRPNRDVDVTYRATGAGPLPDGRRLDQRVRWLAASQTMRIDPPTAGLYVIVDYAAKRMSVVREATRSVVDMAAPEGVAGMAGNPGEGTYVRRGEDTVAGQACTEWETLDHDRRKASVCITADGVLLRASTAGQAQVSAISVQYAPQDPAVFQIPPDYLRRSAEPRQ
ncbi:MAG TPA: hypothetical protein VHT74_04480 [Acetobacteraceae bacterium]|jgi:hypothetical protein|nr:hypothetical protein [Acetobacteraceae bacterium]